MCESLLRQQLVDPSYHTLGPSFPSPVPFPPGAEVMPKPAIEELFLVGLGQIVNHMRLLSLELLPLVIHEGSRSGALVSLLPAVFSLSLDLCGLLLNRTFFLHDHLFEFHDHGLAASLLPPG